MADELLLDAAKLRALLGELADELADAKPMDGPAHLVVVGGGSYLALHDLRDATKDLDSLQRLADELKAAAARVATRHDGLADDWVNDAAIRFLPAGFDADDATPVFEHEALVVLAPPADVIFVMKLFAARARSYDKADLRALWPSTTFSSAEEAVEAMYAAYPHEERDEHLVAFLQQVVS